MEAPQRRVFSSVGRGDVGIWTPNVEECPFVGGQERPLAMKLAEREATLRNRRLLGLAMHSWVFQLEARVPRRQCRRTHPA